MCLIAFAYKVHPEYPLILIANRDEFQARPTRPAEYWIEEGFPDILAGKDLSAGGTWMGVHKHGKWAALTNYRDLNNLKNNPPSRGSLALDYLKTNISSKDYLSELQKTADRYNDFNLLTGTASEIFYYSNVSNKILEIEPGIHGVSNALLDYPWTKLETAKSRLEKHIQQNEISTESLFEILSDETQADDRNLPETGLSREREKAISSVFIAGTVYGTKCSTLLYINNNRQIRFLERTFIPGTHEILTEQKFII